MHTPLWRVSAFAPLLAIAAALPQQATRTFTTTADQGIVAAQPLTRAALRSQVAGKLKVNYQGSGTVKARVYLVVAKSGKTVKGFRSAVFEMGPGLKGLPPNALPPAEWFPDGAEGGAAFSWGPIGWIADWWNGTSTQEEQFVGDTPPASATETDAQRKEREAANAIFPSGLQGRGTSGASGTTLAILIMPVGGPAGTSGGNINVSGVTLNLGTAR